MGFDLEDSREKGRDRREEGMRGLKWQTGDLPAVMGPYELLVPSCLACNLLSH